MAWFVPGGSGFAGLKPASPGRLPGGMSLDPTGKKPQENMNVDPGEERSAPPGTQPDPANSSAFSASLCELDSPRQGVSREGASV